MKTSKSLPFLALVLALFFLAQALAEMSFRLAPGPGAGRPGSGKWSLAGLSLSSGPYTELAFSSLDAGLPDGNEREIKRGIDLLRRSLRRNPLDYRSRYYLAKAYLRLSQVDNDLFVRGLSELRRAAGMRRANKQIVLDCSQVFFSLWPLLEGPDQDFAVELLSGVMPGLSWGEFSPLVESWSLYVQDVPLLMGLLRLKPDFFAPAAEQLTAAGMPLEKRWEMLALHEANTLDVLERQYNEFDLQGGIGFQNARSLLKGLRAIRGYHRLHPGTAFNQEKFSALRRALLLDVLGGLMAGEDAAAASAAQAKEVIEYYLGEYSGLNELDELQKRLQDLKYFRENDFASLRLKMTIAYRKGDYNGVIAEIESLRRGISFVKREQAADYTDILLLLVDAYSSSKLLTAAESVIHELIQNQPDNPDILWRMLRVQNVLGSEQAPDEALKRNLQAVAESRFLAIERAGTPSPVYLFGDPEVQITFTPAFRAALSADQLVQLSLGDTIFFESYAGTLPEKVVVAPPYTGAERKVLVNVNVR